MKRRSIKNIFGNPLGFYELVDELIDGRNRCKMCGACCSNFGNTPLTITRLEFDRIKLRALVNPNKEKCFYLTEGSSCSVYENRPIECRIYNIIDKKIFSTSLLNIEEELSDNEVAVRELVYGYLRLENLIMYGKVESKTILEWMAEYERERKP